jgi:hypothetical protein
MTTRTDRRLSGVSTETFGACRRELAGERAAVTLIEGVGVCARSPGMSTVELAIGGPATADFARRWGAELGPGRLAIAGAGFVPVTLIASSAFDVAELRTLAIRVLIPVLAAGALALAVGRLNARLLGFAVVAGVISTLLYDSFRFAFMAAGWIQTDPIPHIGDGLHLEPEWVVGYLWRYLGNGTGLALAFVALGLRGLRSGALYGLFVCGGLLFTLVASPYGTTMLFALTPATVVMAIGGHVIYGVALGLLTDLHDRRGNRLV